MQLSLDHQLAKQYTSPSQKIRVITESWVDQYIFCPACGRKLQKYPNNKAVADFFCDHCHEDFELKSKKKSLGRKIVDGEYRTMINRLNSRRNPNLFLLTYNPSRMEVTNFLILPKYFFTPNIIEKRNPLSQTARRAGWIGCNILLQGVPQAGKIYYVHDRKIKTRNDVLSNWSKTRFLKNKTNLALKGWTLDLMTCIEKLGTKTFSLAEIYQFENILKKRHPSNKHIKDKIRQQLQYLRDKNYIKFAGGGEYKIT